MQNYFDTVNETVKEYFNILSSDIPDFLNEYINTLEMQRIGKISMACGTDYTSLYHHKFYYSNLDHSVGVALIVWHFTKDKKQTLAGLFHDIATPVFKHCIDFMNGDYEKQESTEEFTIDIIKNSKEIMTLLNRDKIKIEEVDNYHIYPIADNNTPQLSADRLEYTLITGIYFDSQNVWGLEDIRRFYNDLTILKNEQDESEIGFKTFEIAEEYIQKASEIWPFWISNKEKIVMQFYADCLKRMKEQRFITVRDLYCFGDKEVIEKIKNCEDKSIVCAFEKFEKIEQFYENEEPVQDKYCISFDAKRRYVNPLVQMNDGFKRIYDVSEKAQKNIDDYWKIKPKKYAYFDFNF